METTRTKPQTKDAMSGAKGAMSDAEDTENEESGEPSKPAPVAYAPVAAPGAGGYFHILKKGQGYWTRMGTVAAIGLLGLLTGNFLYGEIDRVLMGESIAKLMGRMHLQDPRGAYLLVALFALVYAWLAFHFMNKPTSVDFLIATDSEMKKVNWTTRKELMGSTKVVIGFVVVIAVLLLAYDLFFQLVFYLVGVLKTPPFFLGH
jgi:preprotein translocase SecE subunit